MIALAGLRRAVLFACVLAAATPAVAGNTLIARGRAVAVAKSTLTVTPDREWNKMGARPGRHSETWTIDGDALNDLTFYGGIERDRPIFREVSKKHKPLPRFSRTMLLTDVPTLFEASYRIALGTPLMTIDAMEPATLAGSRAIRFRYTFTRQGEEVERKGEAIATIVNGRLFMMSFEAPRIFYYDRDLPSFHSLVSTATL